jgi:hypothetical protein
MPSIVNVRKWRATVGEDELTAARGRDSRPRVGLGSIVFSK